MPMSETRAKELAELEPPAAMERITRFVADICLRLPATAGDGGAAPASGGIGQAGRAAGAFSAAMNGLMLQGIGSPDGALKWLLRLMQPYQLQTADIQAFSLWLVKWNDKRSETDALSAEEFAARNRADGIVLADRAPVRVYQRGRRAPEQTAEESEQGTGNRVEGKGKREKGREEREDGTEADGAISTAERRQMIRQRTAANGSERDAALREALPAARSGGLQRTAIQEEKEAAAGEVGMRRTPDTLSRAWSAGRSPQAAGMNGSAGPGFDWANFTGKSRQALWLGNAGLGGYLAGSMQMQSRAQALLDAQSMTGSAGPFAMGTPIQEGTRPDFTYNLSRPPMPAASWTGQAPPTPAPQDWVRTPGAGRPFEAGPAPTTPASVSEIRPRLPLTDSAGAARSGATNPLDYHEIFTPRNAPPPTDDSAADKPNPSAKGADPTRDAPPEYQDQRLAGAGPGRWDVGALRNFLAGMPGLSGFGSASGAGGSALSGGMTSLLSRLLLPGLAVPALAAALTVAPLMTQSAGAAPLTQGFSALSAGAATRSAAGALASGTLAASGAAASGNLSGPMQGLAAAQGMDFSQAGGQAPGIRALSQAPTTGNRMGLAALSSNVGAGSGQAGLAQNVTSRYSSGADGGENNDAGGAGQHGAGNNNAGDGPFPAAPGNAAGNAGKNAPGSAARQFAPAAGMAGGAARQTAALTRLLNSRRTPLPLNAPSASPSATDGADGANANAQPLASGAKKAAGALAVTPEMGQITLIAPPLKVASRDAEQSGIVTQFDWSALAPGAAPLDAAGLARLQQALPPGAQALYPALPLASLPASAVNLKLAPSLLAPLMEQGYGADAAQSAGSAARSAQVQQGRTPAASPLKASIVPGRTPIGRAAGLLPGRTGQAAGGAGALAEAGQGQAKRGGALDFLGLPVRLAPSLGGNAGLAHEVAARQGVSAADSQHTVRPDAFAALRNTLLPQTGSVTAEPDRGAWAQAAPAFGLRGSNAATLLAPDARAQVLGASSPLPQMQRAGAGPAFTPKSDAGPSLMARLARPMVGSDPVNPGAMLGAASPAHSLLNALSASPSAGASSGLPTGLPTGASAGAWRPPALGMSPFASPAPPFAPSAAPMLSFGVSPRASSVSAPMPSSPSFGAGAGVAAPTRPHSGASSRPIGRGAGAAGASTAPHSIGPTSIGSTGGRSHALPFAAAPSASASRPQGSGMAPVSPSALSRHSAPLPIGGLPAHRPISSALPSSGPLSRSAALPPMGSAASPGTGSAGTRGGTGTGGRRFVPVGASSAPRPSAFPVSSGAPIGSAGAPHRPSFASAAPAGILPTRSGAVMRPAVSSSASGPSGHAPSVSLRTPAMALPPPSGSGSRRKANAQTPIVVQRSSSAAAQNAETQTAQAKRDALPNTAERGLEASEVMLLANEVHGIIKRRLAQEGERMGLRR